MKTFEYKGFDSSGRACRGLVEALDLKEAREKLSSRGVMAEKVTAAGEGRSRAGRRWRQGLALDARAAIYRELGALLRAGIPLEHALEVLISAPELGENRSLLAGTRDRIAEGSNFAAAFSAGSVTVSAFERAVLEVGERAGTLETVLDRLAGFLEEQKRLEDRIQTALIYPAIVFALAIGISFVMLSVMIPRVGKLLADTNIALPMLTRFMMAFGRWVVPVGGPLLAAAVLAAVYARKRMQREEAFRIAWDRALFRVPVFGRGYAVLVNLRFSRTLALLLSGGVPLVEGVALAGRATGSPWVGGLTDKAAEDVRHGMSLAEAVRRVEPLAGSLPGWIQAGEASGQLEGLLENAGTRFQQYWDRLVSRSLAFLEPVLILCVGVFVLLIALAILLPVLSLNRSLM